MAITGSISAHRTSGVAPLYVSFDATGTRSTTEDTARKAHRNLHYVWDFGDPTAGSWSLGNSFLTSKNAAVGGVAAHVYETPGSYTVTLKIYDINSVVDTQQIAITVSDINDSGTNPNLNGANVILVNNVNDADFSAFANNATATKVNTNSLSTALTSMTGNKKRILFKRGSVTAFSSATDLLGPNLNGRVHFGSYGSGALPILSYTGTNPFDSLFYFGGASKQDWVFTDLDIRGGTEAAITNNDTSTNILFLRITASGDSGIFSNEFAGTGIHSGIALVDCNITVTGGYWSYFASEKGAIMGCSGETTSGTVGGGFRTQYFTKSVFQHNRCKNSFLGYHLLKWGGPKRGGGNVSPVQYQTLNSEFSVCSDNDLDDRTGQGGWMCGIGTENSAEDERVNDTIFERNWYRVNTFTEVSMKLFGAVSCTIRNNLFDNSGGVDGGNGPSNGVDVDRRGVEPVPDDNWIYNNVIYRSDALTNSNSTFEAVKVRVGTNTVIKNNIGWAPGEGSPAVMISDAGTGTITNANSTTTNVRAATNSPSPQGPLFASGTPTNPADFQLQGGSTYAGTGEDNLKVFDDYFGNIRKFYGTVNTDVGFHALDSTSLPGAGSSVGPAGSMLGGLG